MMKDYSNVKEDNMKYDIEIKNGAYVTLSARDIDDILSAAFDGDLTGYWCLCVNVLGDGWNGYASEQLSRGYKLSFTLFDGNDTNAIGLSEFLEGFKLWYLDNLDRFSDENVMFDPCSCDSVDADCILQYAVFGELVYG